MTLESGLIDQIKEILPTFENNMVGESYENIGIDSIDLVALRVLFEREFNTRIPDMHWLEFDTISDILKYIDPNKGLEVQNGHEKKQLDFTNQLTVNMPQMAIEALSENWLFKEIGDTHWAMICNGLQRKSYELESEMGGRLYATFVRIKIDINESLKSFKENETMNLSGEIERFGESMFFSKTQIDNSKSTISAKLMTTFSVRNSTDNTSLAKSQPAAGPNTIKEVEKLPDFGQEYRLMRKGLLKKLKSNGDFSFVIKGEPIFQMEYTLNPYYDINGVNLLYFAAYPVINDFCESVYFTKELDQVNNWAAEYFTVSKDVFYFANCNIYDTIIFELVDYSIVGSLVTIQNILRRKSDGKIIARIFNVKRKV